MYGQPWSMYAPQTLVPQTLVPQTLVPQTYPSVGGVQLAPQGFLGNLLGQLAGPAGQAFGGLFGQPQIGNQIGQTLGGLSHLLPFQAAPGLFPVPWTGQPMYGGWGGQQGYGGGQPWYGAGQLAPQGIFGNLLGQLVGPVGQTYGAISGQPQIGRQIGQT